MATFVAGDVAAAPRKPLYFNDVLCGTYARL